MLVDVQNGLVNILQNAYIDKWSVVVLVAAEEYLCGAIKTEVAHALGSHLNKWVFSSRRNVAMSNVRLTEFH